MTREWKMRLRLTVLVLIFFVALGIASVVMYRVTGGAYQVQNMQQTAG